MGPAASEWHFRFYALVPHPSEPRVLVVDGSDGWSLPYTEITRGTAEAAFGEIRGAFERELGLDLTALRRAFAQFDEATRRAEQVLVMEHQRPEAGPPSGSRWIDLAALAQLPLAQPEHRLLIEDDLREAETGVVPSERAPWARSGWYAAAVAWIGTELSRLGYTLAAPIDQVRTWCLSCVLRAPTAAGDLYFKEAAALPLFADEPRVMAGLAELFPEHVPAPLARDVARRWMLLPDAGRSLREEQTVAAREEMLRRFGRLQRAAAAGVHHLLAIGCLDRRPDRLVAQLDDLLDDPDALAGLAGGEVEQLRAIAPRLKAACAELMRCGVPATLVHGDLNLGNVALRGGQYLFFDWTDACVSHPFFDLLTIVWEEDAAARARLLAAYLQIWTAYAPLEELHAAWKLAEPLCSLHQAISYRSIVVNIEPAARHEFDGVVAVELRRVLAAFPASPDVSNERS